MKTQRTLQFGLIAACTLFGYSQTFAETPPNFLVDLELSLVVDVSGSVDAAEFRFQMDGYAAAFENPLLHAAISGGSRGQIAVNLIQFASSAQESLGWTLIDGSTTSNTFAADIRAAARLFGGGTNIDSGINLATNSITGNSYTGNRTVIDVSGDGSGANGSGRDSAIAAGITTINGIVISDSGGSLFDHFTNFVITPDGFVEEAVTFEDFEAAVLRKLVREITGGSPSEDARLLSGSLHFASIAVARSMTRDVGGRLFRMRTGVRPEATTVTQPAPPMSDKGGMAKGGMVAPITTTYDPRWEIWGQIYYSDDSQDAQTARVPGTNFMRNLQAQTDTEVFGGNVGVEYRANSNVTLGLAFGYADTDVDTRNVATADISTWAIMPYVSYYRPQAFSGADFYADLLYAYSDNDYDTRRIASNRTGSTDGTSNQLEFNTGLNFRTAQFVHGPFGQFRWLDGDIDGYTEDGLGGLTYADADYESLATQLGYQVSYPIAIQNGVVVPQFTAAWEHEFEENQGTISGIPLGELDEDLAVLGLGVGWYLNNGWNGLINYEARLGSNTENHYVGLKVGKEF